MPEKHLRRPTVQDLTGLSRSTIYRLMEHGAFPRPVRLSPRTVAWRESDLAAWFAERAAKSEAA